MQPLKRFTQCGSLTMLFGVFLILFGVSSSALTTFGKTNNPPPTQGPVVKGKECSNHDDCASIQQTSCVKDPNDYKLRCLCGDDNAPVNGLCPPNISKGLHHKCSSTAECEDYMVCTTENASNGTRVGVAKFMSPKTKLCLCDAENGYEENVAQSICSGGVVKGVSSLILAVVACLAIAQLSTKSELN